MASAGILFPHITPVSVDYFAGTSSDDASTTCDGNVGNDQSSPSVAHQEACREGSRTAVLWVAVTAFFQNGLAFFAQPCVGWASDAQGRKPFYFFAMIASALPAVWIGLYLRAGGVSTP